MDTSLIMPDELKAIMAVNISLAYNAACDIIQKYSILKYQYAISIDVLPLILLILVILGNICLLIWLRKLCKTNKVRKLAEKIKTLNQCAESLRINDYQGHGLRNAFTYLASHIGLMILSLFVTYYIHKILLRFMTDSIKGFLYAPCIIYYAIVIVSTIEKYKSGNALCETKKVIEYQANSIIKEIANEIGQEALSHILKRIASDKDETLRVKQVSDFENQFELLLRKYKNNALCAQIANKYTEYLNNKD